MNSNPRFTDISSLTPAQIGATTPSDVDDKIVASPRVGVVYDNANDAPALAINDNEVTIAPDAKQSFQQALGVPAQNGNEWLIGDGTDTKFRFVYDPSGQSEQVLAVMDTTTNPETAVAYYSVDGATLRNFQARGFSFTNQNGNTGVATFQPPSVNTTVAFPDFSGTVAFGASVQGGITTGGHVSGTPYLGTGMVNGASFTLADRGCVLCPVFVPRPIAVTSLVAKLNGIPTANGTLALGLYSHGSNGLPNTLLRSTSVAIDTTMVAGTVLTATNAGSTSLVATLHWLAIANFTGATVTLVGTGTDQSALMNSIGFSNHTLTGSNPQCLNTNIAVASGNVLPSVMARTLEYTTNTATNTTYRFRVSAPLLLAQYS